MAALVAMSGCALEAQDGGETLGSVVETAVAANTARVRIAHLSPNAPPVDVCLRAASAPDFAGISPVLFSFRPGLAYSRVTRYLQVPAGAYVARVVAAGARNCNASLAGLPDFPLPALPDGVTATVAATGLVGGTGDTEFGLTPLIDDPQVAAGGAARLRFVHAAPGVPAVDVGALGASFSSLFSNVSFRGTAPSPYVTLPAIGAPGVQIAARVSGTNPISVNDFPLALSPITVPARSLTTAFAIGQLGSASTPLSVLVCNDQRSENGFFSACYVALTAGPSGNEAAAQRLADEVGRCGIRRLAFGLRGFSAEIAGAVQGVARVSGSTVVLTAKSRAFDADYYLRVLSYDEATNTYVLDGQADTRDRGTVGLANLSPIRFTPGRKSAVAPATIREVNRNQIGEETFYEWSIDGSSVGRSCTPPSGAGARTTTLRESTLDAG
jgi:hypothetical protein